MISRREAARSIRGLVSIIRTGDTQARRTVSLFDTVFNMVFIVDRYFTNGGRGVVKANLIKRIFISY